MTAPPRFATWLIDLTLPPDLSEAVAGDLWEEFVTVIAPRRGQLWAQLWFVWQVCARRCHFCIGRGSAHRSRASSPPWDWVA